MVWCSMKKFEQLKRQYQTLAGYLDMTDLSDRNISAATADFDRMFELAWKTLKVYLFEGLGMYEAKIGSPREIIKIAAAQDLLDHDGIWLEMLKDRNDDAHIYHKAEAILYMSKIQTYYMPQMGRLITRLKELIPKEDCREAQLPEDLIAYAFAQHIPLYQLVEDMRRTYSCETDEQVYSRWEEYIGHISKNVLDN